MAKVKVDAQGRLVLPQAQRQRLGINAAGSEVELLATPEGVVLEPRRDVTLSAGDDGLRVVTIGGAGTIQGATVLEAIHAERADR
jgi:AbrB family looped-hinge helix DNA binding protein